MTPRRLLFVPLCFLASVHASAQQRDTTAQLAGVVFSAYTGRPLVGATVRSETRETITDSLGRFTLGPLPAGTLKVVFGYGEHVANTLTATLPRGTTLRWTVVLNTDPEAVALPPILVEAQGRGARYALTGFYERLNRRWGVFYTPQDLQRLGSVTVRALLYGSGITLSCRFGECIAVDYRLGRYCPMTLYEDGFQSDAAQINRLRASDLAGVEIYRRSVEIPGTFQAAYGGLNTCGGVIAVWSRYLN
ncbi:MAG TPA: carboxypeptidase regulatory-like domain-containing protein [Gemmatimonadales bacterium]